MTIWDRWHELLDIMAKRKLALSEDAEYQRLVQIIRRFDADAARIAERHARRIGIPKPNTSDIGDCNERDN